MKFHTLATAAALVAGFGSAHALTPAAVDAARTAGTLQEVFVSGASAQRLTFAAYVQEVCTLNADGSANHNDFDIFFNTSATPGNNSRAYSCTLSQPVGNFPAATPVVIYKRDQGGSAFGIGPVNDQVAVARLAVVNDGTCVATANPSPATDIQKQSYNCSGSVNQIPDVGLSDVEPARFTDNVNVATGVTAPGIANLGRFALAQGIFGVAVNPTAYKALQAAQGLSQVDVPVDQSTWTAADIANIPSLPVTFVTSALAGKLVGGAGGATVKKGWGIVIPTSVDANVLTKSINVLRRTEGSGTQAASNLFFLNGFPPAGCTNTVTANSPNTCQSAPIAVSTGSTNVLEAASSGDLESGFATAESLGAYAIGVLGRENNPRANAGAAAFDGKAYRYVKLDGVAPLRSQAQLGNYRFVFESSLVYNNVVNASGSDVQAFAATLGGSTGMGKATTLARADVDTQQGAMALPTYSGAFVDLPAAVQSFSSAVARASGNSNSSLIRQK